MKLFLLSKENTKLAQAEAESLTKKGKLTENVLLIDTKQIPTRLAYTKFISEILFEAEPGNIAQKMHSFNWNKLIKGSFALTFYNNNEHSQSLSREYGGMIYDSLKKPKVNLDKPDTSIIIVKLVKAKKLYICNLEWKNKEKFDERKPHKRPATRPIGLNPRLARACINLTGSRTSIYDPFCGLGSFLIEAGLMKLKTIGSDIDEELIELCKQNLDFYKIKNYKLFAKDALKIKQKYEYIVTDLPYGRNTKKIGKNLHERFIVLLRKILKKKAVIILPSTFKADKIIKKNNLKIKSHFSIYVHGSLNREVYVLEK